MIYMLLPVGHGPGGAMPGMGRSGSAGNPAAGGDQQHEGGKADSEPGGPDHVSVLARRWRPWPFMAPG